MQQGGPVMYVIIACSLIALTIFVERILHLFLARTDTRQFMESITGALRRNKIKEAIEDAGLHEVPKLEKNIKVLATIAHITPLLGLLGTVLGMVRSFQIIQEKATALYPVNPADLAGGIWQALITTVAGLSVAIPTFVAYNYLVGRVESIVLDMERNSTDLVNILSRREK